MNQILYAEEERKTSQIDIKKVALFFAISITMFGIVLAVMSIYSMNKNKKNEKVVVPVVEEETNNIAVELSETDDKQVTITVQSDIAISHIVYKWNDEASETINETGKTNITETLEIPVGENTLEITVIDSKGIETKKTATYTRESTKPIIEEGNVIGSCYEINVTSENELEYVTYKWNNEKEVKDDMYTYENKNKFEKKIEIPSGENTLKIEAKDVLGNITTKSKEIKGYVKPVMKVVSEDGYLKFSVTAEDNIKTVEFEINNKKYIMTTDTFGVTKTVKYKVPMTEGWNYLIITATTEKEATDTSYWKYELRNN